MPKLIASLAILIPGVIATSALFRPGFLSVQARVALSFTMGFAVVGLTSWALVSASALTLTSFWILLAIVTIGLLVVALRDHKLADRWSAFRREARVDRWTVLAGLVLLLALAFVRVDFSPLRSMGADTPMRYWADGVEIASGGEIPARTLQYGNSYTPATSKMILNCFTAAMDLVTGNDALLSIGALTWLVAIFWAATLWWLGSELGLRLTAPLLPLLAITSPLAGSELGSDLLPYRAENFGRIVAFCAVALTIRTVREKGDWRAYAGVALLFGIGAGTHFVPTVVAAGVLFWWLVYWLIRKRFTKQHLIRMGAAFLGAILLISIVWILPGGNLAWSGTQDNAFSQEADANDPTLFFSTGRRRPLDEGRERVWYVEPDIMMRNLIETGTGKAPENPWLWLGLGAAITIGLTLVAPDRARSAGVAALGLTVNIVGATLAFDYLYGTFTSANLGPRRLFDYAVLPVWLVLLLAGECLLALVRRIRMGAEVAVAVTAAVVAMALLIPDMRALGLPPKKIEREVADLDWVAENLPCDARIVSNLRTGATFQVLTGRVGVNEGMGPFFRPAMLDEVNKFLVRMNDFYVDPPKNRNFVETYDIDYVMVARAGYGRNPRTAPGFPGVLDQAGFLSLVHEGERFRIYEVVDRQTTGDSAQAADHPGFDCREEPILR